MMNKKYLAFVLAAVTAFYPASVYADTASETEEISAAADESAEISEEMNINDLNYVYSSFIAVPYDEGLETLKYEEAEAKALRNNTSLKTLSASMELAEDKLEISYLDAMADSGEGFSNLISFLSSKSSYDNSELSKAAQEESVKHSMKQSYINIIESQREVSLGEMSLKKDELNLAISKIQLSAGKISQSDYDLLQLAYNTAKESLESKKSALELDYVSLNLIMGADTSKRYNFVMPAVYEPFQIDIPIESYINGKVALSNSVRQSKKNYETTKQTSSLTAINSEEIGAYQSAQNSLNSAEMSYFDTKDSVYESLYKTYNSIVENEKNYESALEEFKLQKAEFERTQVKYSSGKVSYYELISAQYTLAEKENSLLSSVYDHMLLKEELTNTDLM